MRNILILTMVLLFTVAFNGATMNYSLNGHYSSNIIMNDNSSNAKEYYALSGSNLNQGIRDDDPLIDPTPPDKAFDNMRSSNFNDDTYHASYSE